MLASLSGQNSGEIVLIHKVPFLPKSSAFFGGSSDIFFLVFGENEFGSPATFTSASFPLSTRVSVGGLGNTEYISSVVPLHVFLQMHLELPIGIGGARDTSKGVFSAPWAELLVHVLSREETSVTAFNEGLKMANSL